MLTKRRIRACRAAGCPLPPPDCERFDDVFDWRRPAEGEPVGPDTPISFRWRFEGGRLTRFLAYGWRKSEWEMGVRGASPRNKKPFFGILSARERDEAAEREFGDSLVEIPL